MAQPKVLRYAGFVWVLGYCSVVTVHTQAYTGAHLSGGTDCTKLVILPRNSAARSVLYVIIMEMHTVGIRRLSSVLVPSPKSVNVVQRSQNRLCQL